MERIFLIGYMGAGKSTVGELLAQALGYEFIDMDYEIEKRTQQTISNIFAEKGENEFRKLEYDCLHEIGQRNRVVISTGGGAPCFFNNLSFMKENGLTVYLKVPAEQLKEKLEMSRHDKRPLISGKKGNDLLQYIKNGLAEREPFYLQATLIVTGTYEEMVNQILTYLSIHQKNN